MILISFIYTFLGLGHFFSSQNFISAVKEIVM